MRYADVDQPRFLAAGYHFDGESQRGARFAQELRGILCDAKGIGPHSPDRAGRKATQPLAKARKGFERANLGGTIYAFVRGEAGAQADGFAHRIQRIDLALDYASDLEVETVRSKVDSSENVGAAHAVKLSPWTRRSKRDFPLSYLENSMG